MKGSAPPSVHGSRVDLATIDKGSAIYLGCAPPRQNSFTAGQLPPAIQAASVPVQANTGAISKLSASNRGSSLSISGRSSKSPKSTPPASPKKQPNQSKIPLKAKTAAATTTTITTTKTMTTTAKLIPSTSR